MENCIKLTHGDWYAEILPHFGMNAVTLRHFGRDILRHPRDIEELRSSPYLFGTPLLFPANRTKGGRFFFDGNEFGLPLNEPTRNNHIHGLLYDAPFEVMTESENEVTARFINNGERYPFPFEIVIRDLLDERGYERAVTVTNTGDPAMPFTLAFHTTFVEPRWFSAPIGKRFEVDENYIPTGNMLSTVREYRDGCDPSSRKISGFFERDGKCATVGGYVYEFSEEFDNVILFNALGEMGLLCIEPQAGEVNGLNSKRCKILKPNESAIFTHRIGI